MLVHDLCTGPSGKLDRVTVKPFDAAHELDPVHKEHHNFNFTVAKVCQEHVLDRRVLCTVTVELFRTTAPLTFGVG